MSKKIPVKKSIPKKPVPQVKKTIAKSPAKQAPSSRNQYFMVAGLLLAIFIVYSSSLGNEFINYDDDFYILNHPYIKKFTFSHIGNMFSEMFGGQYAPIPFIMLGFIHMIGGFDPVYYIMAGILMHLTVTLLVFIFIRNLTGKFAVAILTAALFGVAPMLAEAVTWISGMCKTASYAIFFMGALITYLKYAKTQKVKYLVYSILLFLCSCFCKEQAVALTLALFAIDLYLKRKIFKLSTWVEKIPFFIISIIFSYVTLKAVGSNREVITTTDFSLMDRIVYASYAMVSYLEKLLIPYKLSFYYPYPSLKSGAIYVYPFILAAISFLFFWAIRKKKDYIIFGGLFFLISMIFSLALQIISVREVVMADRYAYISSIGFFFILAYGGVKLMEKYKLNSTMVYSVFGIYLLVMGVMTSKRTEAWKDTLTATSDVLSKYKVPLWYVNRGFYYRQHNQYDKALKDYNDALVINPNYEMAYQNRGTIYFIQNKDSLAYADFSKALELNPKNANAWSNRGAINARKGKLDLAISDLSEALKINPKEKDALTNRSLVYYYKKDYEKALVDLSAYIELFPEDADMINLRGLCYSEMGKFESSLADYNTSIQLKGDQAVFYQNRGNLYLKMGDKAKAKTDLLKAQQLGLKIDTAMIDALTK